MRAALGNANPHNTGAATQAWQTGAPIDLHMLQVVPWLIIEATMAAKRRAAMGDSCLQRSLNALMQGSDFVSGKRRRQAQRMDSGTVECFIGVDVAQTRHYRLIEQHRLDRSMASRQPLRQHIGRELGV